MPSMREQVPPALRMPVGVASLVVGVGAISIGYILSLTGMVLVFGLHPIAQSGVSTGEALTVTVVGMVLLAVGITGWRGFMYFAY